MGIAASFQQRHWSSAARRAINSAMPAYYATDEATSGHVLIGRRCWHMVCTSDSPAFDGLRVEHGFGADSYSSDEGVFIFKTEFNNRLCYMYPETAMLFNLGDNPDSWILMIVGLCLGQLDDAEATVEHISQFTKMQSALGVRAYQYGDVGSVFLWTLRRCLGPFYDAGMNVAWTVLFSSLLRTIVPLAVSLETAPRPVQPPNL